jgi:hypothetical protein
VDHEPKPPSLKLNITAKSVPRDAREEYPIFAPVTGCLNGINGEQQQTKSQETDLYRNGPKHKDSLQACRLRMAWNFLTKTEDQPTVPTLAGTIAACGPQFSGISTPGWCRSMMFLRASFGHRVIVE